MALTGFGNRPLNYFHSLPRVCGYQYMDRSDRIQGVDNFPGQVGFACRSGLYPNVRFWRKSVFQGPLAKPVGQPLVGTQHRDGETPRRIVYRESGIYCFAHRSSAGGSGETGELSGFPDCTVWTVSVVKGIPQPYVLQASTHHRWIARVRTP